MPIRSAAGSSARSNPSLVFRPFHHQNTSEWWGSSQGCLLTTPSCCCLIIRWLLSVFFCFYRSCFFFAARAKSFSFLLLQQVLSGCTWFFLPWNQCPSESVELSGLWSHGSWFPLDRLLPSSLSRDTPPLTWHTATFFSRRLSQCPVPMELSAWPERHAFIYISYKYWRFQQS